MDVQHRGMECQYMWRAPKHFIVLEAPSSTPRHSNNGIIIVIYISICGRMDVHISICILSLRCIYYSAAATQQFGGCIVSQSYHPPHPFPRMGRGIEIRGGGQQLVHSSL
jgi:hypothetical protein